MTPRYREALIRIAALRERFEEAASEEGFDFVHHFWTAVVIADAALDEEDE